MSGRYQEGYVNGGRKTREELTPEIDRLRADATRIRQQRYELGDEIDRLRAALRAYLDYCAPEDKWQGDPVLLRIRRQMRAALGDEQKAKEPWCPFCKETPCRRRYLHGASSVSDT